LTAFTKKRTAARAAAQHGRHAGFRHRVQKDANSGQTDLFGNSSKTTTQRPQAAADAGSGRGHYYNTREQLLVGARAAGTIPQPAPAGYVHDFFEEQTVPLSELKAGHDGKPVTVGGVVTDMREILTKKGDKMAFVKIEDKFGEIEVILFPSTYQQTIGVWERDKIVLIRGKVNARDREGKVTDEIKIMVDDAREITAEQAQAYQARGRKPKVPKAAKKKASHDQAREPKPPTKSRRTGTGLYPLSDAGNNDLLMDAQENALMKTKGPTDVVLVLGPDASKQAIKLPTSKA
jgi:DNA polymerase III alpha subunit